MGCSSETARKRTQHNINGYKNNNNNNKNRHSNSYKTNNNNNNKTGYCDKHKCSDSNNLLVLSSELICQSNTDSDEESTNSKENNNCRQLTGKAAVRAIGKTRKQTKVVEEENEGNVKEAEKQVNTEDKCVCESVKAEVAEVLVEEIQCVNDRHTKFCPTCVNLCTHVDLNNNNSKTNTNKGNTCENFWLKVNGSNNCCHRQFAREQIPQERVTLTPQAEKDDQDQEQKQQQIQEAKDELRHGRYVCLPPAKEMDRDMSTRTPTKPDTNIAVLALFSNNNNNNENGSDNAIAIQPITVESRSAHSEQGSQGLWLHARETLTKRLIGLREQRDLSVCRIDEGGIRIAEKKGVGGRSYNRSGDISEQETSRRRYTQDIEQLQMAYERGRHHTKKSIEQEQRQLTKQKQKQRNDSGHLTKCGRREKQQQQQEAVTGAYERQESSAMTYCHQKQNHNHQRQQLQKQHEHKQQQQQMTLINTKQMQFKAPQLQQHHSAQKQQQHKQLQHKESLVKPQKQQQQQHQQLQRHRLRRGIQTMAAAAYGAFSYIGHNYYHLLGNSISFYAASSVILVLCYLTTTTAAAHSPEKAPFDKHPIFDESSSDKEILDLLLEKKRYDKRLLPPVNGTLTVNVNVLLLSLASPDESSLKYEVEFLLNQQWNDPRLQYGNKSHYDFLNALHHHDSIWTPDTYFIMHGDFKDPIIPMHFALRIYRNGTITYAMRRHLILSCQGSLHIFPFDDPKCSFSMESISYEEAQIKYVWKNDEDTLRKSPSLTTLNAYLIKNQTTPCDQNSWRGNYSCLEVELTFTRDRAYYFTTVFIPGIILVTSSFITFWLEWNAVPARVMIGVTTMLNFFTTSNGFRSTLPVVSNLTAMNVWDGVCMCFIYASLLEFVCVNYMGRKRPQHNAVYRPGENPVTQRLPAVLSRIGVILASPLGIIEREFHAALSSEKATVGTTTSTTTTSTPTPHRMMHTYHGEYSTSIQQQRYHSPTQSMGTAIAAAASPITTTTTGGISTVDAPRIRWEEQHGGIIGVAMQNLRARSIRRRTRSPGSITSATSSHTDTETGRPSRTTMATVIEPVYHEPNFETAVSIEPNDTTVTVELEPAISAKEEEELAAAPEQRLRSISTNTPPFIMSGGSKQSDTETTIASKDGKELEAEQMQSETQPQEEVTQSVADGSGHLPVKPPRRKRSRSNSPAPLYEQVQEMAANGRAANGSASETGEKGRDVRAPNEIVACTTCGGSSSPCTHSANNGCATETCFVQVRKKEPPHPIRIAKTIDVIARITFPTAYAIFLIFFFVHYKGFS